MDIVPVATKGNILEGPRHSIAIKVQGCNINI
jgi:hypothetical protein